MTNGSAKTDFQSNAFLPNKSQTNEPKLSRHSSAPAIGKAALTSSLPPLPIKQVQTTSASPTAPNPHPKSPPTTPRSNANNNLNSNGSTQTTPPTPPYPRTNAPLLYAFTPQGTEDGSVWSPLYNTPIPFSVYPPVNEMVPLCPPPFYVFDYERRPPKSTELFDPNAPKPKSHLHNTTTNEKRTRHSVNVVEQVEAQRTSPTAGPLPPSPFPRSPSHDSFFTLQQDEHTGPVDSSVEPENQHQNNSVPSTSVKVAKQLDHILEVFNLPEDISVSQLDILCQHLQEFGCTVKFLEDKTVLAVFKTSEAAKNALIKLNDGTICLRPWKIYAVFENKTE